jgi:hypothetical protein
MSEADEIEAALRAQLASIAEEVISPGIESAPPPTRRAMVEADPRLLELVEQRFRPDIARTHELPLFVGELPFHLDPVAWRTGFLEVSEGGPPLSIREGLLENVPQANLRDLFRPEYSQAPIALERHELSLDPGGFLAMAELRAARTLEPPPRIDGLTRVLTDVRTEWNAFVRAPWKPYLPDEAPRRDVHVLIEPSLSA